MILKLATYISKVFQTIEIVIFYTATNPCAWSEFRDFANTIIFISMNRFISIINNFMKYKRIALKPAL